MRRPLTLAWRQATDELIAATSVIQSVPLVTRNERIRRSKLVSLEQRRTRLDSSAAGAR
jgi:hypothetical protein